MSGKMGEDSGMWIGAAMMLAVAIVAANVPVGAPIETKPVKTVFLLNAQSEEKMPSVVLAASAKACTPGNEDRSSSLCAEWKAADATLEAAKWEKWAFVVGTTINILTLVFLAFTFTETRRSSYAAIKALNAGRAVVAPDTPKVALSGTVALNAATYEPEWALSVEINLQNVGARSALGLEGMVLIKAHMSLGRSPWGPVFEGIDLVNLKEGERINRIRLVLNKNSILTEIIDKKMDMQIIAQYSYFDSISYNEKITENFHYIVKWVHIEQCMRNYFKLPEESRIGEICVFFPTVSRDQRSFVVENMGPNSWLSRFFREPRPFI